MFLMLKYIIIVIIHEFSNVLLYHTAVELVKHILDYFGIIYFTFLNQNICFSGWMLCPVDCEFCFLVNNSLFFLNKCLTDF